MNPQPSPLPLHTEPLRNNRLCLFQCIQYISLLPFFILKPKYDLSRENRTHNRRVYMSWIFISFTYLIFFFEIPGNLLYNKVVNKSFTAMFTINTCLMVVATLYCLIFLKWQTRPEQMSLREAGVSNPIKDFFDLENIRQTIRTLTKKRAQKRRLFLWFLLICMAFYTFQRGEWFGFFLFYFLASRCISYVNIVLRYSVTLRSISYILRVKLRNSKMHLVLLLELGNINNWLPRVRIESELSYLQSDSVRMRRDGHMWFIV